MDFCARFEIGEAFPAEDPVARFVTMLAVICNDVVRTAEEMARVDLNRSREEQARQVRIIRWLLATHFEAVDFIKESERRNRGPIAKLLARSPEAEVMLRRVLETTNPSSERYFGASLKTARNTTFHYSTVDPNTVRHGTEDVFNALTSAADATDTIEARGTHVRDLRFWFADQVVLEWLPPINEQGELINRIMAANDELIHFTEHVVALHLTALPTGVVMWEIEPPPQSGT